MATGMGQSGGTFAVPEVPGLGTETWAMMGGVDPGSPLVGGRGPRGGPTADFAYRQVALGAPDASAGAAAGAPMAANWREIFNLKGNPVGWVLLAAIAYLGLSHISLHGSARAGKARASAAVGTG